MLDDSARAPAAIGCDELRELARGLLDAEDAYRFAPTLENTGRLARVRRRLEDVLTAGVQR